MRLLSHSRFLQSLISNEVVIILVVPVLMFLLAFPLWLASYRPGHHVLMGTHKKPTGFQVPARLWKYWTSWALGRRSVGWGLLGRRSAGRGLSESASNNMMTPNFLAFWLEVNSVNSHFSLSYVMLDMDIYRGVIWGEQRVLEHPLKPDWEVLSTPWTLKKIGMFIMLGKSTPCL